MFDPHDLAPRKGRVFIASGLDAADAAFATLYGGARLTRFEVWAERLADVADAVPVAVVPVVEEPRVAAAAFEAAHAAA